MISREEVRDRFRAAFIGAIIANAIADKYDGMAATEIVKTTGGVGIELIKSVKRVGWNHVPMCTEDVIGKPGAASLLILTAAESLKQNNGFDPAGQAKSLISLSSLPQAWEMSEATRRSLWEIKTGRNPNTPSDYRNDPESLDLDAIMRCIPLILHHGARFSDTSVLAEDLGRMCRITHAEPAVYLAAASITPMLMWSFCMPDSFTRRRAIDEKDIVIDSLTRNSLREDFISDETDEDIGMAPVRCFDLPSEILEDHLKLREAYPNRETLMDAVPFCMAVSLRNARSFAYAIQEVVNAGGATGANAALVGAIVGANVGISGIPKEWRDACPDVASAREAADGLLNLIRNDGRWMNSLPHPNSRQDEIIASC
ncbi:MAG: ADP-ribosylglycohydrolase family protein [Patescibacteria group bacterium]|nr:ADP-ribosylglycohydrolase family protein [Patescibacteria group bacterium]